MAGPSAVTQCQLAQEKLEEAINSVTKAELQLRENAREVRWQLQSSVSRQQEALRCRELWLLSQIDLLENVKMETLNQQLHQLHRLRGQFDVLVHQMMNKNDLTNQLKACMEKLSSLSLTPEETPDLNFTADTHSLRQAITGYGAITAQIVEGVVSQSPTPQRPLSCPITVKKQKLDNGALADWLLETHPTKSCTLIGYQSSKKPQDWLLPTQESQTRCPVLTSMDFLQAWGQLKDLEAWLLQDHAPRERADSSSSSSFSIEKIDESDFSPAPEEQEPEEEDSDWLITPTPVSMEVETEAERWRRVLKPFEGGWSSGEWLQGGGSSADCGSCCQTRPLEIENLGQLKCLKTPPPTSPVSPPPVATSLDAWLQQAPQSCRANEPCSSYSHCLSDDNCGRHALSQWLLQLQGRDKNGMQTDTPPTTKNVSPPTKNAPPTLFTREEQKVQAILEAWLHPNRTPSSPQSAWVAPEEEKASREEHSSDFKLSSSPFLLHPDPELWVLPKKTSGSGEPAEVDKWLLKKKNQERLAPSTICDLFSCMKVGGDKEKWLHKAPVQM